MTTPFLGDPFPATGASASRALPDRLADVINVKDYGATGDGFTNDAPSIQAALDASFGPPSAPHGAGSTTDFLLNKPVYFPPGNYRILSQLNVRWCVGAKIIGAGSRSTIISYHGPIAGTPAFTSVFRADSLNRSLVQGITFEMNGGNSLANKTVAFNWTWAALAHHYSGSPPVLDPLPPDIHEENSTDNLFVDCRFTGATWGVLCGGDPDSYESQQCDESTWINCNMDNCFYGLETLNQNAIQCGMYGGSVTNCTVGIQASGGSFHTIQGVTFAGNGNTGDDFSSGDIVMFSEKGPAIIGCRSTSPKFAGLLGPSVIRGCRHVNASAGAFCINGSGFNNGSTIIDDCYTSHGYLVGQAPAGGFTSRFLLDNFTMDNPNWSKGGGAIVEWVRLPTTFANLPTGGWRAEGLLMRITDSPTAAWGATVTAGGGGFGVTLRFNGTNWTVVGI